MRRMHLDTSVSHANHGAASSAGWVIVVVLLLGALAGLAGCTFPFGQNASSPDTAGWTDVTPPTSQYVAHYTVSPDVPGLILGCIGDRMGDVPGATVTPAARNEPAGPARLWRTRDGGLHWQALNLTGLQSGCEVTLPSGGKGTVFAMVQGGSYGYGALVVSHDAGDTWRTVDTSSLPNGAGEAFQLTSRGVFDRGMLYSFGRIPPATASLPPVVASYAFSVSANDGGVWNYVERTYDPQLIGYGAESITRDYRTPGAWFRLLVSNSSSAAPLGIYSPTLLQHSADGGQTWQVLGEAGLADLPVVQHSFLSGTLLSVPGAPTRLCLSWRVEEHSGTIGTVQPTDDLLAASDDAGASWGGALLQHYQDTNSLPPDDPVVAMDGYGTCYVASRTATANPGRPEDVTTTFSRLAPRAGTTVSIIAHMSNWYVGTFGVYATGDGKEQLVAVVSSVTRVPCTTSCAQNTPMIELSAPHLMSRQI